MNGAPNVAYVVGWESDIDGYFTEFLTEAIFSTKEKAEEWLAWQKKEKPTLDWETREYPLDPEVGDMNYRID